MLTFSGITCTRNSTATLPDTLRSVQAQQGVALQHNFVDGDFTDGTLDLLRAQPGDVQVITGVSGGIARAMNAGIAAATGDVVAHLHSDDYYLRPDVLATVSQRLQQDGSDWLFGRIVYDEGGTQVPEQFVVPRFSPGKILRRNFVPHPATFIRRQVFQRHGVFHEDFRARFAHGPVWLWPEFCARYLVRRWRQNFDAVAA